MPNRIIKESVCTSETLNCLSDFQENFFYRLIVNCDDYGRMDARAAILKARLYPLRDRLTLKEIEGALRALADVGCVEVYEVGGKPYLRLPSWGVHQQIRAKKSKFPPPDEIGNQVITDDSKCPRNPIQSESNPNTKSNAWDASLAAVMAAYMDKINPTPSQSAMEELEAYVGWLGEAVCLRAIEIAQDERKTGWSYVRGILSSWKSRGVKSLADVDAMEAEHRQKKHREKGEYVSELQDL